MSGVLLMILGAWAALVPFIGPYFDLAYTPDPNTSWHWTAARGWLEVLPGAVAFAGGLLLLVSASRLMALVGGWLAAAAGAWLVVGPPLADVLNLNAGTPDPSSSSGARAAESLLFFFGIGAVILFVASVALGRLSVTSMRDIRAAERRAAAESAAAEAAEQDRVRREPTTAAAAPAAMGGEPAGTADGGRHASDGTAYRGENDDYPAERGDYRGDTGYPAGEGYPSDPRREGEAEQPHHWWSRHHRVGSAP
jgi:MFS family permease